MPELAEVETLKNYLKQKIPGLTIDCYLQYRENLRYPLDPAISVNITNSKILDVTRRAKFLNIHLDNDYIITFHLGMSGKLTIQDHHHQNGYHQRQKHDHIIIDLNNETSLVFNDARRFGMIYCYHKNIYLKQDFLKNMGPEPLENEFDAKYLQKAILNRSSAIKTTLMDNKIVVGVGNIYAAESLFMSKINPSLPANKLDFVQIESLTKSIKIVLNKAIENGGTSLRDFVNGDNNPGYFQQKLNVYGRNNLPCLICNSKIQKIVQAGRSSFFCPECQK